MRVPLYVCNIKNRNIIFKSVQIVLYIIFQIRNLYNENIYLNLRCYMKRVNGVVVVTKVLDVQNNCLDTII